MVSYYLGHNDTQIALFLCGFAEDRAYVPPCLMPIADVNARITDVLPSIDRDLLWKVWQEVHYKLHVCHITRDTHVDHLSKLKYMAACSVHLSNKCSKYLLSCKTLKSRHSR
ncbi:hypothetical protein AVEN_266452-1 [Araneus ventricosus]|uniref:Uncharacterized protein n=1 Tax=Araneus ventricosus TaxID=182803 RepID=A0A4Y2G5V5_ARAVE|nr:hypothetical protein AVEN_266452-1 [Araneus ventricosus]